jgi:DNA-binding response OmpR family regulator
VVDDEIAREGLAVALRRKGWMVFLATDGEEAPAH